MEKEQRSCIWRHCLQKLDLNVVVFQKLDLNVVVFQKLDLNVYVVFPLKLTYRVPGRPTEVPVTSRSGHEK